MKREKKAETQHWIWIFILDIIKGRKAASMETHTEMGEEKADIQYFFPCWACRDRHRSC